PYSDWFLAISIIRGRLSLFQYPQGINLHKIFYTPADKPAIMTVGLLAGLVTLGNEKKTRPEPNSSYKPTLTKAPTNSLKCTWRESF
ncbi:hypothetical protein, partial [Limosilactobacillus fermentum]|uniref:hypothetical protein n=1 Tax=Limosilactobacillus fermentum TaxID=1613 RepID=UPI0022E19DC9